MSYSRRLGLEEPEPATIAPHPLLEGAHPTYEQYYPECADTPTHSVTFDRNIDAGELLGILSEPMHGLVSDFCGIDVRQGLRSLTYPNSRVMKNIRHLDPHAKANILDQRPAIHELLDVIDHPGHTEMVPAKVHVLSPELVRMVGRDVLEGMKPTMLTKLCADNGIPIDQIRVWRLKEGDRHNRRVRLDALHMDTAAMEDAYVANAYCPKIILPGFAPSYIPYDELPKDDWAQQKGFVELLRRLPRQPGDDVDRWEVLLRHEGTPRHVVRPKIQWRTDIVRHEEKWIDKSYEYHRQQFIWQKRWKHFVAPTMPAEYDSDTHTIVHTSALLGPVMLAGAVARGAFQHEVDLLRAGNHYNYWDRPRQMPKLAGVFPALLQTEYVTAKIMSTPAFRRLERYAIGRDLSA